MLGGPRAKGPRGEGALDEGGARSHSRQSQLGAAGSRRMSQCPHTEAVGAQRCWLGTAPPLRPEGKGPPHGVPGLAAQPGEATAGPRASAAPALTTLLPLGSEVGGKNDVRGVWSSQTAAPAPAPPCPSPTACRSLSSVSTFLASPGPRGTASRPFSANSRMGLQAALAEEMARGPGLRPCCPPRPLQPCPSGILLTGPGDPGMQPSPSPRGAAPARPPDK